MESAVVFTALLILGAAALTCSAEHPDSDARDPEVTSENELVEAMEELLGRIHNEVPEKRGIPKCAFGTRCAMRLGPRFGPLCECGRGTYCNSFLLKCI